MAAITASMVGELRAKTDAPMMECKKALTEADGDMVRAEEILRVKLGSKAGKAASRITAEGVIAASVAGTTGAMIEVNCETDFVSKNESFLAFVKSCADLVAAHNPDGIDFVIPGNDDSAKAVALYARVMADAVLEGKNNAVNEVVEAVAGADEFVEVSDAA